MNKNVGTCGLKIDSNEMFKNLTGCIWIKVLEVQFWTFVTISCIFSLLDTIIKSVMSIWYLIKVLYRNVKQLLINIFDTIDISEINSPHGTIADRIKLCWKMGRPWEKASSN